MKKLGLVVFLLLVVGISSCKKDGCTSEIAKNFDQKAKLDDGSCQYNGSVYTSISTSSRDNLLAAGVDDVDVFVDGEKVGGIDVNLYDPDGINTCGKLNVAFKELSWTGHSAKNYKVVFQDEDSGIELFSTNVNVYSSGCTTAVLIY